MEVNRTSVSNRRHQTAADEQDRKPMREPHRPSRQSVNEPVASIVAAHVDRFTTPSNVPVPRACTYRPVPPAIVALPLNFVRSSSDRARPSTFNRSLPRPVEIVTVPRNTTECDSVVDARTEPATVPAALPLCSNFDDPVRFTNLKTTGSRTVIERAAFTRAADAAPDNAAPADTKAAAISTAVRP
jgi:hypothetical protein